MAFTPWGSNPVENEKLVDDAGKEGEAGNGGGDASNWKPAPDQPGGTPYAVKPVVIPEVVEKKEA